MTSSLSAVLEEKVGQQMHQPYFHPAEHSQFGRQPGFLLLQSLLVILPQRRQLIFHPSIILQRLDVPRPLRMKLSIILLQTIFT
jgi:hypothetical protein